MSVTIITTRNFATQVNNNATIQNKVNKVTALPEGKTASDTVTFQDLIDMGIIVIQNQ